MNRPQREMLIEDLMLKSSRVDDEDKDEVAYASIVARARFHEDGMPYLFEAVEKDTGRSLALPSAWVELIERRLEERYAPRVLEEV